MTDSLAEDVSVRSFKFDWVNIATVIDWLGYCSTVGLLQRKMLYAVTSSERVNFIV